MTTEKPKIKTEYLHNYNKLVTPRLKAKYVNKDTPDDNENYLVSVVVDKAFLNTPLDKAGTTFADMLKTYKSVCIANKAEVKDKILTYKDGTQVLTFKATEPFTIIDIDGNELPKNKWVNKGDEIQVGFRANIQKRGKKINFPLQVVTVRAIQATGGGNGPASFDGDTDWDMGEDYDDAPLVKTSTKAKSPIEDDDIDF